MTQQQIICKALDEATSYFKGFSLTLNKIDDCKIYIQVINLSKLDHYIFPKIALESYLSEELNQKIEVIFIEY